MPNFKNTKYIWVSFSVFQLEGPREWARCPEPTLQALLLRKGEPRTPGKGGLPSLQAHLDPNDLPSLSPRLLWGRHPSQADRIVLSHSRGR